MKTLLAIILAAALSSCSWDADKATPMSPVPPSIRMPATTDRADLGEATQINGALQESNRQLDTLIAEGRSTRYELNRRMALLLEQRTANEQELLGLNEHIIAQQVLVDQGRELVGEQTKLLGIQATRLSTADTAISNGEMEKTALRATISKAEIDLQERHAAMLTLATERDAARIDSAESAGTIKQVQKVSTRRLWWALSASGVIGLSILYRGFKVYVAMRIPIRI